VSVATSSVPRADSRRTADRLAAAFLVAVMAIGCLVLWIGIPVGALYVTSRVAETNGEHLLLVLPTTLTAMIVFAWGLFWVNRLYLRVSADSNATEEWDDEEEEEPRFARGPLEPLLVGSLVIAIVALFVWFFGFAHNPSQQVI
jgi:hypothetical protein